MTDDFVRLAVMSTVTIIIVDDRNCLLFFDWSFLFPPPPPPLCCISVDIDECQVSNLCLDGSTCQNSDGGFECLCASGYRYDSTTDTCTGENYAVTHIYSNKASIFLIFFYIFLLTNNYITCTRFFGLSLSIENVRACSLHCSGLVNLTGFETMCLVVL